MVNVFYTKANYFQFEYSLVIHNSQFCGHRRKWTLVEDETTSDSITAEPEKQNWSLAV
jgi:hypothetical protein